MRDDHLSGGFSSIPGAAGGIARLACERLRAEGVDLAPLLSRVGLTMEEIQDRKHRVDARLQVKLLERAAERLQDDCFGFHLAQNFELGEIGLLYYVMASSVLLADAQRNAARYCAINNEGVRLRISLEPNFAIGLDYLNIDRSSDRHHIEFWLLTVVRICRAVTRTRRAPQQIKLRHFRTETPPEIRSYLGNDIAFAADCDEISFPASVGALPVVGADVHLNRLLLHYASEALDRQAPFSTAIRARVEDQIAQLLPHGQANADEIARRLGMSRRTLSRALSAESATFSNLLATVRLALARRYLRERQLPISEIAWLLGYREISSFTHAFIRWTGSTPKDYRASTPAR